MQNYRIIMVIVTTLASCVVAGNGAEPKEQNDGLMTFLERTDRGLRQITVVAPDALHGADKAPTTDIAPLICNARSSGAALRWTADYTTGPWRPDRVAFADRDSTILCSVIGGKDCLVLFSVYDEDPPAAVWQDDSVNGAEFNVPLSCSKEDDLMTVIGGFAQGSYYRPSMAAYRSSSSTPLFYYRFPVSSPISTAWRTAVAANGSKMAGCFDGIIKLQVFLNVFDANGQSLFTKEFGGWSAEYLELSDNGQRLFVVEWDAWVMNTDTGQLVFKGPAELFGPNDLSGDGQAFAGGGIEDFWVYQDLGGGNFTQTVYETLSAWAPMSLKLSHDGRRLAIAFWSWTNNAEYHVMAYDVENNQVVWSRTFTGTGTLEASPESIDGDRDLDRFVVGCWGDSGHNWPELMVFDFNDPNPIFTLDTTGSVMDVAMSTDGRHVAATSKVAHANIPTIGGYIHLIDLGDEELDLRGAFRSGERVDLALYGDPGDVIHAAVSTGEVETTLPNIEGPWYLDMSGAPNVFRYLGFATIPASGTATMSVSIPSNPHYIGTPLYFQGVVEPQAGGAAYTSNEKVARVLP